MDGDEIGFDDQGRFGVLSCLLPCLVVVKQAAVDVGVGGVVGAIGLALDGGGETGGCEGEGEAIGVFFVGEEDGLGEGCG